MARNEVYKNGIEKELYSMAILSDQGDRDEQQDIFGFSLSDEEMLMILCDGMGGMDDGRLAADMAVHGFITKYESLPKIMDVRQFFLDTVQALDREVAEFNGENRNKSGCTLSSALIREQGLFWLSAGDSRIYISRGEQFCQVTRDHNYGMMLKEQLKAGNISEETYMKEMKNAAALVSFLGVNGLPYIDVSDKELKLLSGDIIIIMSDGVYKLLSDQEIHVIIQEDGDAISFAERINAACREKAVTYNRKRDNTTIFVVKMK